MNNDPKFIKLVTVSDRVKFDLITSMLDEYEIPFIVKDDEAGSIMRILGGSSIYGATIYVPDFIYEKARNIVADTFEGIEFDNYELEKEI